MEKFDEVFKISKDIERAKDLFEMARERLNIVIGSIPKSVPYKILEEYYEIAVQLMTSVMYSEGYKTISHINLIKFMKDRGLDDSEIQTLDNMQKFRHGAVYYGRKESGNFYLNHETEIKRIVKKLLALVKEILI